MATKKECDRCHEQWNADAVHETCAVATDIPYWKHPIGYMDRDKVGKTYELCQLCARTVHAVLENKVPVEFPT